MKTSYDQIVNTSDIAKRSPVDLNAVFSMAEKEEFIPSANDPIRRLLLCIDVQNDFVEGGALAVPGAAADIERITRFIYNNMGDISNIMCSLDTHMPHQIFHPCWWANSSGDHPAPYTIITSADVASGVWFPIIKPKKSIKYLVELEKSSKKQLCIWPYHCIEGTVGASLENEFSKMVYFFSVARKSKNVMIQKGRDPLSEMYGIIKPEYDEKNFVNNDFLSAVQKYDEIYVVGEAASHCLMESVKQIAEHFKNEPDITQKIVILEDCTSPIGGFEEETKRTFEEFGKKFGIRFMKSTDVKFGA